MGEDPIEEVGSGSFGFVGQDCLANSNNDLPNLFGHY